MRYPRIPIELLQETFESGYPWIQDSEGDLKKQRHFLMPIRKFSSDRLPSYIFEMRILSTFQRCVYIFSILKTLGAMVS